MRLLTAQHLFKGWEHFFNQSSRCDRPISFGDKEEPINNPTNKSNGPLTILLTVMLFSIASAQTPAANAQSDITNRVDQLFTRFDRPDSPGCALGVAKDGKLIYKKGYGMANLEHDIPISPTTVFNVASASTQFTAMSILLLARQGKL